MLAALAYVCDPGGHHPGRHPGNRPARRRRDDRTRVPRAAPRDRGVRGFPSATGRSLREAPVPGAARRLSRRSSSGGVQLLQRGCAGAARRSSAAALAPAGVESGRRRPEAATTRAISSVDLPRHALARLDDRDAHGARECRAVRAAVALDHHARRDRPCSRRCSAPGSSRSFNAAQRRRRADRARTCAAGCA